MKDSNLDRRLVDLGSDNPNPPAGITRGTVNRIMRNPDPENITRLRRLLDKTGQSQYPRPIGGYNWMKNFSFVTAACLLLAVGFLATWGALNWVSGPGSTAGQNLDLTNDSRIIDVQQEAPFPLALPTWMHKDYNLSEVVFYPSGPEKEHFSVQMTFLGPDNAEPLILTQSNELWQSFDRDRSIVAEARIDQIPALLADLYHYPKGPIVSRRLVIALPDSFLVIESGVPRTPYDQLENLGSLLGAEDLLDIAKGMVGGNNAVIVTSYDGPETDKFPGFRPVFQFASTLIPFPVMIPDVHQTYYFDWVILEATMIGGQLRYYTELVISYAPSPAPGYQITINQTDYTPATRLGAAKMPIELRPDTPGVETLDLWETQGYYGLAETERYGEVPHLVFQANESYIVISTDGRASKEQIIQVAESMMSRPHNIGAISEINDKSILIVSDNSIFSQGYEAIWYRFSDDTLLLDQEGNSLSFSSLKTGQKVQAWHTGIVMDSDPPQAEAVKVVIINPE